MSEAGDDNHDQMPATHPTVIVTSTNKVDTGNDFIDTRHQPFHYIQLRDEGGSVVLWIVITYAPHNH